MTDDEVARYAGLLVTAFDEGRELSPLIHRLRVELTAHNAARDGDRSVTQSHGGRRGDVRRGRLIEDAP